MSPRHATGITRRSVLTALASAAVPHVHLAARQASRPWGVQLYTVRTQIGADPAATLKRVAAVGYTELEVLQPTLSTIAPLASALKLDIVSAHLDAPTAKGEGFDAFVAQAQRLGLRYLVVPWVPPAERPTDRGGFEQIAARLSHMARTAAAAKLRLCYHNHAFEFGQDRDGTRWLDVLMRGTEAAGVQLELDVFWAAIAGADPVALLRQYAGRVALVHLKDKDSRAGPSLVEQSVPRTAFVEVGSGSLDFPSILAAARAAGVRHYFVEQDQTPADPIDSLRKSYVFLTSLAIR
jgi:sugar phosphate isomerase/epimerase